MSDAISIGVTRLACNVAIASLEKYWSNFEGLLAWQSCGDNVDELKFLGVYASIQRNSFILTSVSMLEYNMLILCKCVQQELELAESGEIGKTPVIKNCKQYLEKKCGFAKFLNWGEVGSLIEVRNCLTHSYGDYNHCSVNRRRRIDVLVMKNIGLNVKKDEMYGITSAQIVINDSFCEYSLNLCRNLLLHYCNELEARA